MVSYQVYSSLIRNLAKREQKILAAKRRKARVKVAFPENHEEGLSIVSDNSAETILDINPLESEDPLMSAMDHSNDPFEDSEETLIDQNYEDLRAETDVRSDEPTVDIASTAIHEKDLVPRYQTKRREKFVDKLEENKPVPSSNLKVESLSQTQVRNYSESDIIEKYNTREGLAPGIMEGIIRKVQEEVNLQTQRISKDVVKEISGYKSGYRILSAVFIFFALFLLTFVGWIEFQRFQDIKTIRWEKKFAMEDNNALMAKIQASDKTRATMTEQIKTLDEQTAMMKTQIEQLHQHNAQLTKKLAISEQEKNEAIAKLKSWEYSREKLGKTERHSPIFIA